MGKGPTGVEDNAMPGIGGFHVSNLRTWYPPAELIPEEDGPTLECFRSLLVVQ